MQDSVYTLYQLSIAPSDFEAFKQLVQPLVAATRDEPGAITYEYLVNADCTTIHIIEQYRTQGVLPHLEQTFPAFAEQFLKLVKVEKLTVYGHVTPEIRAKQDGFNAEYFTPFAGFSR